MFNIYNKTFNTPTEGLENVIAHILVEEPDAIDNPEMESLMTFAFEYGLTKDMIQRMEVIFLSRHLATP